jgi:cation diffusion facilitator family transporter
VHHHHGPHRHLRYAGIRSVDTADEGHHAHSHHRVDPAIMRSRAGVRAVAVSLVVLGVTASVQLIVLAMSGSVALLADVIHNFGDALTAVPLAAAFIARSHRAERAAGYLVVVVIFTSAVVAGVEAVERFIHPEKLTHLGALALAGALGFVGNELAAQVRLRAGARLDSAALVADGHHARVDGFVSLGVIVSAIVVWAGFPRADSLIGLAITAVILRVTWQAWTTMRHSP